MDKNAEQVLNKVKLNVKQKFNEVRSALHMREKLLLRQLEVIANTQQQQQMLRTARKCNDEEYDSNGFNCNEVHFVSDEEDELLAAIRSFGRFELQNIQFALQDYEDYIAPADDHETMYKCLQAGKIAYYDLDEETQPEAIVVDFSRNKSLVENNAKLMNKSIINITLQEAKELIRKAKIKRDTHVPPLNLEELNDELESLADAVSSLGRETSKSTCVEQLDAETEVPPNKPKSRKPRFKPKITINNCNGTINLRNIASLTINCANEEAVSAEIPLATATSQPTKLQQSADSSTSTTASSSNYSSNASSRSQSKKQKASKKSVNSKKEKFGVASSDTTPTPIQLNSSNSYRYEDAAEEPETNDVTCDFYNRLLNEIKNLQAKPTRTYNYVPAATVAAATAGANTVSSAPHFVQAAAADSTCDANSNSTTGNGSADASLLSSQIQAGKRLILKNFENLKIVLEANSGDEDSFHPVQIEQWLAEIISETDLEPMQNTDILEHSKINNSESN